MASKLANLILGAPPDVNINPGEQFERIFTFTNNGNPIDVTGHQLTTYESFPTSIKEDAIYTVHNGPAGQFKMVIPIIGMNKLELGLSSYFRYSYNNLVDPVRTSDPIWMELT